MTPSKMVELKMLIEIEKTLIVAVTELIQKTIGMQRDGL